MVKTSARSGAKRTYECMVDGCNEDLKYGQRYYKRHRLCSHHAMSASISVDNKEKRFCQQCSKLHEPELFDEGKKSCRTSLASHNARRRRKTGEKKTGIVQPLPVPAPVATTTAYKLYVPQNYASGMKFCTWRQFFDMNHMNFQKMYSNQQPSSKINIFWPSPPPPAAVPQTSTATLEKFQGITMPYHQHSV